VGKDSTPKPLAAATSNRMVFGGGLLVLFCAFGLLGDAGDAVLGATTLFTTGALFYAVFRNRPEPRIAFNLMLGAAGLFLVAGILRSAQGAKGNIANYSTLIPDYFAYPGYLLFAAFLIITVRSRRRLLTESGVALETAVLAISSFLVAWVALIDPVLQNSQLSLKTRISFAIYPPTSAFLAATAARLVFTEGRRERSHLLLMSGILTMFVGDVVYFLSDTAKFKPPLGFLDAPYSMSFVLITGALLHPTSRLLATPVVPSDVVAGRNTARIAALALALLLFPTLTLVWSPSGAAERFIVDGLGLILTLLAVTRLFAAIAVQSKSEARFAFLATHDDLTGLPNRTAALLELAARLKTEGGETSIILLDLDNFKLINDARGHTVGDTVLCAAAERIRSIVTPDSFVARVSGDEFVIVTAATDEDKIMDLANRLLHSFDLPLNIGREIFTSVSVGVVAGSKALGDTPAMLLADADNAVHRAKGAGRNTLVRFDRAMRENVAWRLEIEEGLRQALAQDDLRVYYQPILNLRSGLVEGFEALVRWPRASGFVSPAEFIPVAEDSGLIIPLGDMVLYSACRQLSEWRARDGWANMTVSVNVSAQQLRGDRFLSRLNDILDATGLPGEAISLEITERLIMIDSVAVLDQLEAIRALGVKLSIDDFGTGFSSLAYLQHFPIDAIKIDRSFVVGLGPSSTRSIASAVVAIADSLGIDTIAEGVETEDQLYRLATMGCEKAQGFLIARPGPANDIVPIVEQLNEESIFRSIERSGIR
jgi:diguanylate cyclase